MADGEQRRELRTFGESGEHGRDEDAVPTGGQQAARRQEERAQPDGPVGRPRQRLLREDGVGQQRRHRQDGQQQGAVRRAAQVRRAQQRVTHGDHADPRAGDRRSDGRPPQRRVADQDPEAVLEARLPGSPLRQEPRHRNRRGDHADGDHESGRTAEEPGETGTGESGGGERHGVEAAGRRQRGPGDRGQLRGPAAGDGGVEQAGDDRHRDDGFERQVPEDGGDQRDPAGVAAERDGEQPSRRRAAVQQGAEHRPPERGGCGQPGEQGRPGVRAHGHPEQQQGGPGQLVAGPGECGTDQVTSYH
ncbi:hypothetical protein Q5425_01590 [Amycolatopsis sp. A133]|uniref:hypothetical protein n=1 Tax=Amycolatopsis sp. A133 TaxID=3064472 RepID=UPI0027F0CD65|nr:hypothetical protein [Amycolatopsis sp. A133]MDQ7802406.1 hypothetical protein [Amycolatopsis sp. A133]